MSLTDNDFAERVGVTMTNSLSMHVTSLRVELASLDHRARAEPGCSRVISLAACHLQSAIDILDQPQSMQAITPVTIDHGVQRTLD